MNLRKLIQSILDKTLLKDGVLSHHLKRVLPDKIDATTTKKVNNDEYVVFRFYAPPRRIYGDGKPKIARHLIDVNYYYYDITKLNIYKLFFLMLCLAFIKPNCYNFKLWYTAIVNCRNFKSFLWFKHFKWHFIIIY